MKFQYSAQDDEGKAYKGIVVADNEVAVRKKLTKMGLYSTGIHKVSKQFGITIGDKVNTEDIIIFTERLSIMLNAGLPIIKCLRTIGRQTENKALQKIIYSIRLELEGGFTFSQALSKHKNVFSTLYISLIKAGEVGGVIDEMLMKISEYLDKEYVLRQSIRKALTYPAIVVGVAIIIVAFLVIFIVPVFAKVYQTMRLTLPLPTLFLLGVSNFVASFWWAILTAIFGLGFGYKIAKKSKAGCLAIDRLKLKMPIFGRMNCKVIVSRFISTLGVLVASGVSVMEALRIARQISNNKVMANIINKADQSVREGGTISEALGQGYLFSPMVIQMIAAGEEAGVLDKMLKKSASFLDRDVDNTVQKLVSLLEPLLTFFLAMIVGFIALAIYLPMFDVIGSMSK